jgi:hypothetical protein
MTLLFLFPVNTYGGSADANGDCENGVETTVALAVLAFVKKVAFGGRQFGTCVPRYYVGIARSRHVLFGGDLEDWEGQELWVLVVLVDLDFRDEVAWERVLGQLSTRRKALAELNQHSHFER